MLWLSLSLQISLEQSVSAGREKDKEISELKQLVAAMEDTIEKYKIKEQEHETMRRKLHNTIQELKVLYLSVMFMKY